MIGDFEATRCTITALIKASASGERARAGSVLQFRDADGRRMTVQLNRDIEAELRRGLDELNEEQSAASFDMQRRLADLNALLLTTARVLRAHLGDHHRRENWPGTRFSDDLIDLHKALAPFDPVKAKLPINLQSQK